MPWSIVPYIVMLPPLPDDEDGAPAQPASKAIKAAMKNLFMSMFLLRSMHRF
jgi:hypothetical protein